MEKLERYRRLVNEQTAERCQALVAADREGKALAESGRTLAATEDAQAIAQRVAQTIQQTLHEQVARVVTRCLEAVFDDPYEFRITFERKRGKTEASLGLLRDGLLLDDPLNEVGGGVIDVASLGLRLAALLLTRPPRRRLIVLDEPFRFLRGRGNRERTRRMLVGLAEELGIQFVLSSDIEAYRLGTVIELGES